MSTTVTKLILSYGIAYGAVWALSKVFHYKTYTSLILTALIVIAAWEIYGGDTLTQDEASSFWRLNLYVIFAYAIEMSITKMRTTRALQSSSVLEARHTLES